jgi:SAM-dependent methyltransferase
MLINSIKRLLRSGARTRAPQPSPAHTAARAFWRNCSSTFLTNPEYYDACETVLKRDILPSIEARRRALDAGCGNGRFTEALAKHAEKVDAFDLSPMLIEQARAAAVSKGTSNIDYWMDDIVDPKRRLGRYDLVACMGVLSTVVDDWAAEKVARLLMRVAEPGAYCILRDSVSLLPEGQLVKEPHYAINYRNKDKYEALFTGEGWRLKRLVPLVEFGTSLNAFVVFQAQK